MDLILNTSFQALRLPFASFASLAFFAILPEKDFREYRKERKVGKGRKEIYSEMGK